MQENRSEIPLKILSSEPAATLRIESKPIKVLLIDGNYREAYLIRKAMAEAGAGAIATEYTDRLSIGLERLAKGGIDVLLLDPSTLDSQGVDSLSRLRARAMGVPIVVLSAAGDETSEVEALERGAQEYLVKGRVDSNLLVRSIHHAIARQRLASEIERKIHGLASNEAYLGNIIRSNPDGIILVDKTGIVHFVNPAAESLFGCKAEQLLGKSLGFLPAVEGGKTELGIIREDGEKGVAEIRVVETQYNGETAYLASLHDITERKQAEEESKLGREAAEAWATAADEAAEAARTAAQEAISRAEEEARLAKEDAEAAKTAAQEVISRAEEEARLAKEDAEAAKTAAQEAMSRAEEDSQRAREQAETAKTAAQEAIAKAEEEAELAKEDTKTAKIAAQEAISRAEEKSPKFDPAKSEFMSNILHELRTPLHSITGFTRLMLDGEVPDHGTRDEFLTIISEQSEHLRQLVDELVDISPAESDRFEVRKERVSTKELLQSAVRELYSLANQRNIILCENIPRTLPDIKVDGTRLRQVMLNLLNNAIKFSNDGGSVSVKAESQNGELLVQVTDQGIGIAQEAIPSLFEKFYQAADPARGGGLGLGLYISKQIIEAHGGRIWAESIGGEGSTFSFTLPLEPASR